MSVSNDYRFSTKWLLPASPQVCWDELLTKKSWTAWWPGLTEAAGADAGSGAAGREARIDVGSQLRLHVRSPLGYRLRTVLEVTQRAAPHWIAVTSRGDLHGTGYAAFSDAAPGTRLRIVWNVRTQRSWMNALAPVASGPFVMAHWAVMRAGRWKFARHLAQQ